MGLAYTVRKPEEDFWPLLSNSALDTEKADTTTIPANDSNTSHLAVPVPDRAAVRITPLTVEGGAAGTFTVWLCFPTAAEVGKTFRFIKAANGTTSVGTTVATLSGTTQGNGPYFYGSVAITNTYLGNPDLVRVVGDTCQQSIEIDPRDAWFVVMQFRNGDEMACRSSLISLGS